MHLRDAIIESPLPWVAIILTVAVHWLIPIVTKRLLLWRIPTAGKALGNAEQRRKAYMSGARRIYTEGYEAFKNGIFQIATSRKSHVVVVSAEFLPELKKIPDDILSFSAAIDETMETKYTRIDSSASVIPHTIKASLTPSLVRLNPVIHQEAREALARELPSDSEWHEIDIHHILLRVVAMISGRVFVGPELCHNEEYIDAAINHTIDLMAAQSAVSSMRPWLRPFLADSLPEVKKLDQRIKTAEDILRPIVEHRKKIAEDSSLERPDDMLQWLLDGQEKFSDEGSKNIAKVQLGLTFAAIHTTVLTSTNAFFDMIAMPEFALELQQEAKEVLAKHDNVLTHHALQAMKKMDSFLKEAMRFSPGSMASFQRKVLKQFTLPNGQVIPAGVTIEVPSIAINMDPTIHSDPETFDPLRFYIMREEAREKGQVEAAAKNQFVSVSQQNLTFGYGRHACPGRFFATNEIKMILATALTGYEFKMPGDEVFRYPNIEFAQMSMPDFSKKIMCRRISNVI